MAAPFCLMAFTEESYHKESVNFISECQEMNIQTDVIELLHEISEIGLGDATTQKKLNTLAASDNFKDFIVWVTQSVIDAPEIVDELSSLNKIKAIPILRRLRACYSMPLKFVFSDLAELSSVLSPALSKGINTIRDALLSQDEGKTQLSKVLSSGPFKSYFESFEEELATNSPHSLYPTSVYRESRGSVVTSNDDTVVEAVMSCHTYTSIRIEENVLGVENDTLKNIYRPLERCVCLVDQNVDKKFGEEIEKYFAHHSIILEKLVYRAMEIDKALNTVEKILGNFKSLGVSRNEPVLIIGGGVLADVGGLACALYHRNTPYVMVGSSIVSAIDAGPSPRTCCDGYGYKNLLGAYHSPILTITDRTLFKTLKIGWLRHGVAEIIKMAVVKDEELFCDLEKAGSDLFKSKFGIDEGAVETAGIKQLSDKILAAAMRSYVSAEYENLYETHQCRPHAYGHTWSPGFEIKAGLLHGHAVSIGMGFGAYLSKKKGWIDEQSFLRIIRLIENFELSLWHDILLDEELIWGAQERIIEKRGGNLAAAVPKGKIGECGYINELSRSDLRSAISEYHTFCKTLENHGIGIEPLCSDVGLEDPSTVHKPFKSALAAE